jgi:hypothetical protein
MPDADLTQAALPLDVPGPRKGEYALPEGARIEQCRSCGAQIVWARTEADRPIPLSLATVQTRDGQTWLLSHFSDCEHAKEWSKRKA